MDPMQVDSESQPAPQVGQVLSEQELDKKYPNRPRNHSETLPFHDLFLSLFNPLNDNKKKSTDPAQNRKRLGPHAANSRNPHEIRRGIIESFVSKWRQNVGDDIYPAFRLIIPEKDRERAMYGLKEKVLGKMLVKIMKIDKHSEDGFNLLNWKLPGTSSASRMAGDFAGRCFEVISKRPMRTEVGNLTIGQVNDLLNKLSAAPREETQLPILEQFYRNMNAEELMWLIRIILRQMKVGATERTIFEVWHPDAESLFNVSSSLRRVCWELHDPKVRLEGEDRGVSLMQCYQPQLAQFQIKYGSFQRMVEKMRPTEDDDEFWIEEKVDGERMQMHMVTEENGSKKFAFWSRKAKEYTYLYGNSLNDSNGSLTRHLGSAFNEAVENIILDGEMITWNMEQNAAAPFGTLKTAALSEQRNPFSNTGLRPLYRVFDILYLNDQAITMYTLRDRRKALERSVIPVPDRFELHGYTVATKAEEIEPHLRKVVEEASEGLVLKNPRSAYRLNTRHDDWMKVKPEYMTEFGESLDCLVIGGYYGSGHRGGTLSSFLCGLRATDAGNPNSMKFQSFFKVGGGFTASDYDNIRHQTDGRWKKWDPKNPPNEFVELAGNDLQYERPDMWIRPDESIVIEVKAAQMAVTDQFKTGLTLRFPRFVRLRSNDRDWQSALSVQTWRDLKHKVEEERKDKEFKVDTTRRKTNTSRRKKILTVAGYQANQKSYYSGPSGTLFNGLNVFVVTEMLRPEKKSKVQLEEILKAHGANILQTHTKKEHTVCIADRRTVKVASIEKSGKLDIIRPIWVLDCIAQNRVDSLRGIPDILLPLEPNRHVYFATEETAEDIAGNVDQYGDSYARDVGTEELRQLFSNMEDAPALPKKDLRKLRELVIRTKSEEPSPNWIFQGLRLFFDFTDEVMTNGTASVAARDSSAVHSNNRALRMASVTARFAGATVAEDIGDTIITHIVVGDHSDVKEIRRTIAVRSRYPRVVTSAWIEDSWKERTLIDEERYTAS